MKNNVFRIKDHVRPTLETLASRYYKKKNGCECRTLLVEGKLDSDIYKAVNKFPINDASTLMLFQPIITYKAFRSYFDQSHIPYESESYSAFDYVIDGTNCGIPCYGIIDNDLGQHNNRINDNLSITETHDHETILLLCYLDRYYDTLCLRIKRDDDRERLIDALKRVLLFTVNQGILEKSSIDLLSKYQGQVSVCRFLRRAAHSYFDEGLFYRSAFDEMLSRIIDDCHPPAGGTIKEELMTVFKKNKELEKELYWELQTNGLVDYWLKNGIMAMSNEQQIMVKKICWYTNGHFFVNQLRQCLEREFGLYFESDETLFNDPMVSFLRENRELYYTFDPMKKCLSDLIHNMFLV